MKIIAMIPARMGSQRVKQKNIRLLNGKPLISHIVDTAVRSNVFDEIYINSESDIFKKQLNIIKLNFIRLNIYLQIQQLMMISC